MDKRIATIRLVGPLIEVSKNGDDPIDDSEILYRLTRKLRFTKVILRYYNQGGKKDKEFEDVALYVFDDKGRLVCQRGWFDYIYSLFKSRDYEINVIDERKFPNPKAFEEDWNFLLENFKFRNLQKECIGAIATRIRNRKGGIIEAAPAFGKTKIISMVCALYPKAKIDIITSGNELIEDIRRHILAHTPEVGKICSGHRTEARITVISSLSLKYLREDADIVLADEVHKLMTDRASAELSRYRHACMFGFTATKDTRIDNAHKRMEGLFGPVIFSSMWDEATKAGLIVPIVVEWYKVDKGPAVSRFYSSKTNLKRFAFWRNSFRNSVIAKVSKKYYDMGLQTLILVETVEHLLFLKRLLPEFQVCFSGVSKGTRQYERLKRLFPDAKLDMPLMERKKIKAAFERREILGAIATTIWTTGVSFDGLQVLVRADGGGSKTNCHQWPGRVARIDPVTGKKIGIVVDFIDSFDPWALKRSQLRQRIYRSNGWRQYENTPGSQLFSVSEDAEERQD